MVEDGVSLDGCEHSRRKAEHKRKDDGAESQLDGRRKQGPEFRQDGFLRDHRLAEIPLQHRAR